MIGNCLIVLVSDNQTNYDYYDSIAVTWMQWMVPKVPFAYIALFVNEPAMRVLFDLATMMMLMGPRPVTVMSNSYLARHLIKEKLNHLLQRGVYQVLSQSLMVGFVAYCLD